MTDIDVKQAQLEGDLKAHERECAMRYQGIEKAFASSEKRIQDSASASNYILIGSGANAPRGNNSVMAQTGSMVMGTEAASNLIFITNATEVARLDSSGNLGIGTSSPTALLHVNGAARASSISLNGVTLSDYFLYSGLVTRVANGSGIGINSANSADNAYIYFGYGTTSGQQQGAAIGRIGGDVLAMFTSSAERARITSAGSLLLGNTTSCDWQVSSAGHVTFTTATANTDSGGNSYRAGIGWQSGTSGNNVLSALITAETVATYSANLLFLIRNSAGGNFVERARINSDGVLLVGATSSDLSTTTRSIVVGNFAVQNGGSTGTYLQVVPGAANGTVDIKADARSGSYPPLTFYTSNLERARITSGGNLLVGTTSDTGASLAVCTTTSVFKLTKTFNAAFTTNPQTRNVSLTITDTVSLSVEITIIGKFANNNYAGTIKQAYSIGANAVSTTLFGSGNTSMYSLGNTSTAFAFGAATKPNNTTINLPINYTGADTDTGLYVVVEIYGYAPYITAISFS